MRRISSSFLVQWLLNFGKNNCLRVWLSADPWSSQQRVLLSETREGQTLACGGGMASEPDCSHLKIQHSRAWGRKIRSLRSAWVHRTLSQKQTYKQIMSATTSPQPSPMNQMKNNNKNNPSTPQNPLQLFWASHRVAHLQASFMWRVERVSTRYSAGHGYCYGEHRC